VFEKNANFFAENGRKSQKIVIITSTPVCFTFHRFVVELERLFLDGPGLRSCQVPKAGFEAATCFENFASETIKASSFLSAKIFLLS
jgi:hypothetical protein